MLIFIRFKSGREVRKKPTIWSLRSRVPPPTASFKLPADVPINEEVVNGWYKPSTVVPCNNRSVSLNVYSLLFNSAL